MSLLYKDKKDEQITVFAEPEHDEDHSFVYMYFYTDRGKFGTQEALASFKIKASRLLEILNNAELNDDEII